MVTSHSKLIGNISKIVSLNNQITSVSIVSEGINRISAP